MIKLPRKARRNVPRSPRKPEPGVPPARMAAAPPAIPPSAAARRHRRIAAVAALAALVLAPLPLAARKLAQHPALAVRSVHVKGADRVAPEDVRELAGVAVGEPWLTLDRREIELRLEGHPWVARARLIRPWPGRVNLCIQECRPVARVEIAGRTYGLCEDLRVVPAGDAELPLIRCRGREKTDPDALARALDWVELLRRAEIAGVEPVRVDVNQGEGDRVVLPERGFTAAVDETIPVRMAARNVLAFLETLDGEGGSRGTLRLISGGTGVWRAAGGRRVRTG